MKDNRSLATAAILLVAVILVPRIYSHSLLVKYDLMYWHSSGNGYAPLGIALWSKIICGVIIVTALAMLFKDKYRRIYWLALATLSIITFPATSTLSDADLLRVVEQGNVLIAQIESYHKQEAHYPANLQLIINIPQTDLVKERRFFYATAGNAPDDTGSWFSSTRAYLGKAPYVICVPLVPTGTLVYRQDGDYDNLPGRRFGKGWFITSKD